VEEIRDTGPTHSVAGSTGGVPLKTPGAPTPEPTEEPIEEGPLPGDSDGGDDGGGGEPETPPPNQNGGSCGLPAGPGGGNCVRGSNSFLSQVTAAIRRTRDQHPNWFKNQNHVYVDFWDSYYAAVVQNLRADGLCAIVDRGGEIAVKNTNAFNDQYHILISSGDIHWGEDSYRATCSPAWF
jgi:hypothetical protein